MERREGAHREKRGASELAGISRADVAGEAGLHLLFQPSSMRFLKTEEIDEGPIKILVVCQFYRLYWLRDPFDLLPVSFVQKKRNASCSRRVSHKVDLAPERSPVKGRWPEIFLSQMISRMRLL